MKLLSITLFALSLLTACSIPPGADDAEKSQITMPSSVFDGGWTWLQTKGVGIAGPYVSDPSNAGYTWKFVFSASSVQGGKLEVLRNGQIEKTYTYTYTVSDVAKQQRLLLNSAEDDYLWELKLVGNATHLYLRNIQECCDNTFEHHFLLTEKNHY